MLGSPMFLYDFRLLLIEEGQLWSSLRRRFQQFVELCVNCLSVTIFRPLDDERH